MKFWIFGSGRTGRKCYEQYYSQLDFCGFIDNDERKDQTFWKGLSIVSYNHFKKIFNPHEERIIIASEYSTEMYAQLMSDGFEHYIEKVYRMVSGLSSFEDCWNIKINSSCGEELWLKEYFDKYYPKGYKGTYVDVGAFHPFFLSNSRWAYEEGWKGVNIDANEDSIKMFESFRAKDKNINCGVTDRAGQGEFFICNGLDMCTFDENRFKVKEGLKVREIRKIQMKTLNEILEENDVHEIDFLDIDVEGLDEKIIFSFDWKKYSPQCVLIEILNQNSMEEVLNTNIHKKMKLEGYDLVAYALLTAMYVKRDKNRTE